MKSKPKTGSKKVVKGLSAETIKYVEVKDKSNTLISLHKLICEQTNTFITLEIDRFCRKFIKDLEKIPLSEDQQDF